jgi:hypothetical protein
MLMEESGASVLLRRFWWRSFAKRTEGFMASLSILTATRNYVYVKYIFDSSFAGMLKLTGNVNNSNTDVSVQGESSIILFPMLRGMMPK